MKALQIGLIVLMAVVGGSVGYLVTTNNLVTEAPEPVLSEADAAACEQEIHNLGEHERQAAQRLESVRRQRAELEAAPLPEP
jgi:hypothetical protein